MKSKIVCFLLGLSITSMFAQDDLLSELDTLKVENYADAAFKSLKVVNFESTKLVAKKEFTLSVAHRFGSISYGFDNFFGLDNAVTRLNFIYGITDAVDISVSRSSYQKLYEGALKYRLIRQKEGGAPITLVGYNSMTINSSLEEENFDSLEFNHRLGYVFQLLMSRKFNKNFSFQLMPTIFHDNLVQYDTQDNTQYALGFGGRYKISKRVSINFDYGWHLNRAKESLYVNPLGIGVDIETGGHVFQLLFTNAQPMNVNYALTHATGDWSSGDVYFGFNLLRRF